MVDSLAESTALTKSTKLENNIHEIGSYLYRVSLALKELTGSNSDSVITKILQSLSESEALAKGILRQLLQSGQAVSVYDRKTLKSQLEVIINDMGVELTLIPKSAFNDQNFAETAIYSLSEEMRKCKFDRVEVAGSNPDSTEINPSKIAHHSKDESTSVEADKFDVAQVTGSSEDSPRQNPPHVADHVVAESMSIEEDLYSISTDVAQVAGSNEDSPPQNPPHVVDQPVAESMSIEEDLYSISTVVCTDNSHILDSLSMEEALRNSRRRSQSKKSRRSVGSISVAAQYVEPIYKSFCCPLTHIIMDDPVTIQSGVTFERKAIMKYFEEIRDSEEAICPVTKERLQGRDMNSNIALRNIIQEWKERNNIAQLKVIRAAFSIGSSDDMILEALKELQTICQRSPKIVEEVHNIGIVPLIVRLLELRDRNVRCTAIEMIRLLASENDGKELIGKTTAIASIIRQLSSSYKPIRHAALVSLIELSKSKSLSEKIGNVRGGILILIQTKYNRSLDTFASEAANQVLKNLEQCSENIKLMADNGFLEPLLSNLIEGNQGRKLQMVKYLGEITLEEDSKSYVIEKTTPVLVQMLRSEDDLTRHAVFKAFAQTSSNPASGETLVEAGIVGIIIDELFTKKMVTKPTDSLKEASAVLVNILESGVQLDNLIANSKGHTIVSNYVAFNIMYKIKNTKSDELKLNLIRMLYQIAKSTKSAAPVVSAVRETEASYTLVELLNNPSDEMAIATINLLTLLSYHIGHLLIERLCKTNGQPDGLIQTPSDHGQITKRQALSVCFLAKLPHENITLNLALVNKDAVPRILQLISDMRRETRHNRYSRMYLEGLVGVLVRFTATLYDSQILFLTKSYNFTMELTDLLTEKSVEEVQRLAATGLEKLSTQSIHLSKQPMLERKKSVREYLPGILACGAPRKTPARLCIAHKGVCSEQNTFCLIEAGAVGSLLLCLENRSVGVTEAALSALSTLLNDRLDIEQSVNMLIEMNAMQQILKALKYHKEESLWHKSLWVLERFLMKGGQRSLSLLSQDRVLYASVVTAFHHGDTYTKQIAEKILRHLDKMPSFTSTFTM